MGTLCVCVCVCVCVNLIQTQVDTQVHVSYRVPLVVEFEWFRDVHLILPEVVERALHEHPHLLVVLDQTVPQRVLEN